MSAACTFTRWWRDVFFRQLRYVIIKYNSIQSPAFVSSCNLLTHRRQKALWVEEACHPEHVRTTIKQPAGELRVPVKEVREPESDCSRLPWDLPNDKVKRFN